MPALDGIRALSLIVVFIFHVGATWDTGGFFAVTAFFTLSGYLITRLLLDEVNRSGAIDLIAFWGRRLRRLLPAALVTVAFVLALSATVLRLDGIALRSDVFAALGYGANWRFMASGQSYAELFQTPSPVLHFWSLAIEEQFYFVYPLVVFGVLWAYRRRRRFQRRLRVVLLLGIAASLATTLLTANDFDFSYYSLPTRASELLVGALLATSIGASRLVGSRPRWWSTPLGVLALCGMAAACAFTTLQSEWIVNGGFLIFALLSAALILSVLPRGPLSTAIGCLPLRALGKISYGAYLFHWPVLLWLTRGRTGLEGTLLITAQAVTTLAFATVSYFLIEQPIRRRKVLRGKPAWIAAPAAIVVMAVAGALVTSNLSLRPPLDLEAAAKKAEKLDGSGPVDVAAPRVSVYGDSTALATALSLNVWEVSTGDIQVLAPGTGLGCGITRGGLVNYQRVTVAARKECGDWAVEWPQSLLGQLPDVALIQVGPFDVADRMLAGDTVWRAPGDPIYDQFLAQEMETAINLFAARDITVVWLTAPFLEAARNQFTSVDDPNSDPARITRLNEILRSVSRDEPNVHIIDLHQWILGRTDDAALRPDGVHFDEPVAGPQIGPWLTAKIVKVLDEVNRAKRLN